MRDRAGWRWFLSLVVLLVVSLPRSSRAEDVFLKNGRVFRGVIASRADGLVRIQMPGGDLSLADSAVLRIETSASSYREYRSRRDAMRKSGANAAAWLELARWARGAGQDRSALEAALVAAGLEAQTPGLQALLGELGYVLDADSKSYVSFEESMARQGRVLYEGAWIPSSERDARSAAYRQEVAQREAVDQAAAERRERRNRMPAQAVDDSAKANGIPLEYAYGYSSGMGGYGGVVLPGLVPRFPQQPCSFCRRPQMPLPPAVPSPEPRSQPRPAAAAPSPSSASRSYPAPRPAASPRP